jgi:hypothetical protein
MNNYQLWYVEKSYRIHIEKNEIFHLYKFHHEHENNDFYTLVYLRNQIMVNNGIKSSDFIKIDYDFALNYFSANQLIEISKHCYEKELWIKKSCDYDFDGTNLDELPVPPIKPIIP